jgi:mono/diheme cytochrome c family protein
VARNGLSLAKHFCSGVEAVVMLKKGQHIFLLLFAGVFLVGARGVSAQSESPSYNRDIRSVLSGKCFKCHGPDANAREADLRLDRREDAVDFGSIVPGEPSESSLIERVTSADPDLRMPPKGEPLTPEQISNLIAWIKNGAKYEQHWSYIKPASPNLPQVRNKSWPANEIDFFTLKRIEQAERSPSRRAEPAVLLRRLYLDLIGLPPSVAEVEAFEADPTSENYEAHVDRLLASKHFGEKWAVHWLDLARYANSNGYQHDDLRNIWPYRDWVIQALNDDMPFDQFTVEQLAGDLLLEPTTSQLVATGFHRNVPTNFSGGAKVPEVRANVLHDRVSTTGIVWLGMTLECAQCHDHKFDPVSQREYYQLYAFFNQAVPEVAMKGEKMFKKVFTGREIPVYASEKEHRRADEIHRLLADEELQLEETKAVARSSQVEWEQQFLKDNRARGISWEQFPYNLRGGDKFLKKDLSERTQDAKDRIDTLLLFDHPATGPHVKRIYQLQQELKLVAPLCMVMQDAKQVVPSNILIRGDYTSLGERIEPGTPAILHDFDESLPRNRLGLARWLVDPKNPLTSRVAVNRIWGEIFGHGLVATPEDFGMQGEPPTHPKLLDWLAVDFVQQGWSVKRLIKTMLMSATYQQTSRASDHEIYSDNLLYTRGSRFRLSAELIRDNLLAISGLLSRKVGGPPVYPKQPSGLWEEIAGATETKYPTSTADDRYRRGIYTVWRRGNPYPSMITFDATGRSTCVVQRDRSNTPLQALTLLNDPVYVEMATAFASIIESLNGSERDKITRAFRQTLARRPTDEELDVLLGVYQKKHSWFAVAQVLLNLDEAINKP